MNDSLKGLSIITLFIMVLIGIFLLRPVSDDVHSVTELQLTENETFTLVGNTSGSQYNLTYNNIVASTTVCTNSTDGGGVVFSQTSDYNITANSTSQWRGGVNGSIINCSYNYKGDDYINDSAARNLTKLVVIFFAISILLIGIGYTMGWFKDMTGKN